MDISNVVTFIAVATLLVISPGPNGFLIAKTVPLSGQKAGFANIAGFVAAFYVHGSLSIFGISVLLLQSGTAFLIFKTLGAIYLIWLGIKALKNAATSDSALSVSQAKTSSQPTRISAALLEGFLTNALNPKVSMFYLAAFPQFMSPDGNPFSAYALVSAHAAVNILWFSAMVLTLSQVSGAAQHPKIRAWLNSITGIVFIGFGAKLALSKSS